MPPAIKSRPVCDLAITLIKHFEGLYLTPYMDVAGIWTIGYGHTKTVRAGLTITEEEANDLLVGDLRMSSLGVQRLITVPLNDNQFGALTSFAFNVGIGNLENSTLRKLLNRGWYEQVPIQLLRWNKAGGQPYNGLTLRRTAEAQLWNTPIT